MNNFGGLLKRPESSHFVVKKISLDRTIVGQLYRYLNGEDAAKYWADAEAVAGPLIKAMLNKELKIP